MTDEIRIRSPAFSMSLNHTLWDSSKPNQSKMHDKNRKSPTISRIVGSASLNWNSFLSLVSIRVFILLFYHFLNSVDKDRIKTNKIQII